MATIPTYESQQTQVTPKQEFFTPSTASAVVEGATRGIQQAGQLVGAIDDYQKAKEKEDYDLNQIAKNQKIKDDSFSLNEANVNIRQELANNPNYKIANQKLEQIYNKLAENPPAEMDARSLKEWKIALYNGFNNLRENNLRWSQSESARLAKQSQTKLAEDLLDLDLSRMADSGYLHQPAKMYNLSLNGDGSVADDYILPRDKAEGASQNQGATEFIAQYLRAPLVDPQNGNGIFFDLRTIEEVPPEKFLGFTTKSGKTQREVGEQQINEFFDKELDIIREHPALEDKSKAYLESLAEVQRKKRLAEFEVYMNAKSQESQKKMGREPTLENTIDYINSIAKKPEMSFVEGKEYKVIPTRDFTALLGTDEDISFRYSAAPIGGVESFDIVLTDAMEKGRFPTGKWDVSEIYNRYAPNGTIQETQALEALMQASPDLQLTGAHIDSMKAENGFNEYDWAHGIISDIASMPEGTDDEKLRKTAAANHALYQAQKEVNGGMGFQDNNLKDYFNAALQGVATNNYMPLVCDESMNDMFGRIKARSMYLYGSTEAQKVEQGIYSRGLAEATAKYNETQDRQQLENDLRAIDKRVLQYRYSGIMDINDLEAKLQSGKPAMFTYHTVPYKYLGFSGDDVYVEVGGIKQKMGF